MSDVDDINDAILSNAVAPRSSSKDGESMQAHALQDQIAAAQHIASQNASALSSFGIRRVKLVPPMGGN